MTRKTADGAWFSYVTWAYLCSVNTLKNSPCLACQLLKRPETITYVLMGIWGSILQYKGLHIGQNIVIILIDFATMMSVTAVVGLLIFAFDFNWKGWQWWCCEGLHIPLHLENINCRQGYPLSDFLEFITLLIIDPMLCDCECLSQTQIGFCTIIQNRNWEMHLLILFLVLRWSDWVCLVLVLPWRCGSWWRQNVGEPIPSWSWPVTWPRKGGHGGTAQHLQWVICSYVFKYMYYNLFIFESCLITDMVFSMFSHRFLPLL